MVPRMQFLSAGPDETLIRQGEPGDRLIVLLKGAASVRIRDGRGEIHKVDMVRTGDVVGEMALLTNAPRNADVVSESDIEALSLSARDFTELVQEYPEVAMVLTTLLADRLYARDPFNSIPLEGYQISRCLGKGGMAVVYQARDHRHDREVALKMMSHRLVFDQEALQRFRREADLAASFYHPRIARVYGRFKAYHTYFLVMEYCDGPSLRQFLQAAAPLDETNTRRLVGQVASALRYIHERGVVHRDLTPSNVMLNRDGTCRLTDFGLSRRLLTPSVTQAGMIVGSPHYMAPEQLAGDVPTTKVDLYALGCIAYEALTGHRLFNARNVLALAREKAAWQLPAPEQIRPNLAEDLHAMLRAALEPKPGTRDVDLAQLETWDAPLDSEWLRGTPRDSHAATQRGASSAGEALDPTEQTPDRPV